MVKFIAGWRRPVASSAVIAVVEAFKSVTYKNGTVMDVDCAAPLLPSVSDGITLMVYVQNTCCFECKKMI